MIYNYSNKITAPNLDQIHIDIANSSMADKNIEWCKWDSDIQILSINFTNSLIPSDKLKLDDIVFQNS